MNSSTYGMSPSLHEEVARRLRSGEAVVEVCEKMPSHCLRPGDVYLVWRDLWSAGLVTTSPYSLVQERVRGSSCYDWKVIVLCALMNRTHARQVRPMMWDLFLTWPTPESMAQASAHLEELLRPLGFANRRSRVLREMSTDYACGVAPERCHGVGQFGRDALDVFVYGRTDVRPRDGFLSKYVMWVNTGEYHES